jgi:hypothetical protein
LGSSIKGEVPLGGNAKELEPRACLGAIVFRDEWSCQCVDGHCALDIVLVVNLLADRAVTELTVTKRYPIGTILFLVTCDKMDFPIETVFHGTEMIGRSLQA